MAQRYGLPKHLFTSDPENLDSRSRLMVDNEKTEFFQGQEFRSFLSFNIAGNSTLSLKFVSTVDFVLYDQTLVATSGGVRLDAFVNAAESSAFNTALPVIGKNRMANRPQPFYESGVSISSGGAFTGGEIVDTLFAVTGSQGGQVQASQSRNEVDARGLPAGTYFLKLTNTSTLNAVVGLYKLWWAERS